MQLLLAFNFFLPPKRLALLLCAYGFLCGLSAQTPENLVPNPSFERFSAVPIGWFYNGKQFTKVMKYWNTPTSASPDIFGPKVIVPKHWEEKGFGKQMARTGSSMVGITTYGCVEGKPHCREYVQIQLSESLVIGQKYYLEFWVSNLPKSLRTNNLGAYFATEELQVAHDSVIALQPQVVAKDIISTRNGRWARIGATFQATEEAAFLVIGNFAKDKDTKVLKSRSDAFNYGYYYVDDVLLKKEKPILAVPIKPDDLSQTPIKVGAIVTLKNIFFETDEYELLPRSFVELHKLLNLLQKHPNMLIEIRGHTDSQGNTDYNQYLSRKRAKAVVLFLINNGVEAFRLQYKGFGSEIPAASNKTYEGRQLNRRVEFRILSNEEG